jgi:hypothetical protein
MKRTSAALLSAALVLTATIGVALSAAPASANPITGAAFTTTNSAVDGTGHCQNGNEDVNCNIYDGKTFVWLNGGPVAASVGDGTYFFAVVVPGGQGGNNNPNDGTPLNLSDTTADPYAPGSFNADGSAIPSGDLYTDREFSVSGGTITNLGTHQLDSNKIRLMPYDDTTNNGGVYILAICSLDNGYPVNPSDCKYDAFKIKAEGEELPPGHDLAIVKDAEGSYNTTFTWTITKEADKTLVKQVGGTATFTYTIQVTHDGGSLPSDIKVTGTIKVYNPNVDENSNVLAVSGVDVTDQLSDGTDCTVTDGSDQTLTQFETDFLYECDLNSLPQGDLQNTATVTWPDQFLDNGQLLNGSSIPFTFNKGIAFTETKIDDCVSVTDSYAGNLGTACVGDPNPKTFTYSRTVPIPQFDCVSYDNTATFTTNTTGKQGSADETVTVCGPAKTGALTMGYWQNKNGQKIIKTGHATSGVCDSGTWLRGFPPFQDLNSSATCTQVATYVYNVIKAATCGGVKCNAMLKAQDLATSLDVYFSDPALGGNRINAPGPIGNIQIDLTLICKMIDGGGSASCAGILRDVSSAFGGNTCLFVYKLSEATDILRYAASQSNAGGTTWYGNVKSTQVLAKDAFDSINNPVAYTC